MIEYTLVRSHRKTIALYVRNGKVEVRAPLRATLEEVAKFVASKEAWITEKLLESTDRYTQREQFTLRYGDSIPYLGKLCPIAAKIGSQAGYQDGVFYMPPDLTPEQIQAACILIYRLLAKRDIPKKVDEFAKRMSVRPASVKISNARTRWGSCSAARNVSFAWRLIMASDDVINYVVVHELAHIYEMNHSKRFWVIVEDVMPNYRDKKAKLKALQEKLNMEDWD